MVVERIFFVLFLTWLRPKLNKRNPRSTIKFEVEYDHIFKRMFICFKAFKK